MKEQLLEPLLRRFRIKKVLPILKTYKNCILLDIGCGWEAKFLNEIVSYVAVGIGIDFKAPEINSQKIKTIQCTIDDNLPFDNETFDVVTMMAVLEHLKKSEKIVYEIYRVLKNDGIFCGTVPSKFAKPVLEFLSYKLGIVNPDEIRDHKKYYMRKDLQNLFLNAGFNSFKHQYFQFFMNNFFIVKKENN